MGIAVHSVACVKIGPMETLGHDFYRVLTVVYDTGAILEVTLHGRPELRVEDNRTERELFGVAVADTPTMTIDTSEFLDAPIPYGVAPSSAAEAADDSQVERMVYDAEAVFPAVIDEQFAAMQATQAAQVEPVTIDLGGEA